MRHRNTILLFFFVVVAECMWPENGHDSSQYNPFPVFQRSKIIPPRAEQKIYISNKHVF